MSLFNIDCVLEGCLCERINIECVLESCLRSCLCDTDGDTVNVACKVVFVTLTELTLCLGKLSLKSVFVTLTELILILSLKLSL